MQHDLEIRVKLIDLCEEVLRHCAEMNYALILKDLSLLIRLAATFNPLNASTVCETHQHETRRFKVHNMRGNREGEASSNDKCQQL